MEGCKYLLVRLISKLEAKVPFMSPYEIIKNSLLFSDLNEEEIAEVSLFAKPFKKGDGELFFKQGENGEDIFIIEQGTAELFVRVSLEQENKVAEFHKFDHFGELSIFNGRQRSATAKARGATSGVIISGNIFSLIKLVRKPGYVSVLKKLLMGATNSLRGMTNLLTSADGLPLQTVDVLPKETFEEKHLLKDDYKSNKITAENLSKLHIFKEFNVQMIDELLQFLGIINLEKQDLLFSQNSIGDNCYIVVSGALQIVVTDTKKSGIETNTKVALIAPGRPVGHLSFFDNSSRSAAAIAAEDTILLKLSRNKFDQLISDGSEVGFLFLFALLDDLVDAMKNTNKRFQFAISQPGGT